MREAAVLAGLIPNTLDGHQNISFVDEGKATAHFAVWNGLLTEEAIQVALSPSIRAVYLHGDRVGMEFPLSMAAQASLIVVPMSIFASQELECAADVCNSRRLLLLSVSNWLLLG